MGTAQGYALGLALCVASLAQGQEVTAERPAPGPTEMRRVSQILGSTVRLNDGSGYGRIEDIVIGVGWTVGAVALRPRLRRPPPNRTGYVSIIRLSSRCNSELLPE